MEIVVGYGGSISAEHGIGVAKAEYLNVQKSEAELRMMKVLKDVFDPKNILNRGKILKMN